MGLSIPSHVKARSLPLASSGWSGHTLRCSTGPEKVLEMTKRVGSLATGPGHPPGRERWRRLQTGLPFAAVHLECLIRSRQRGVYPVPSIS